MQPLQNQIVQPWLTPDYYSQFDVVRAMLRRHLRDAEKLASDITELEGMANSGPGEPNHIAAEHREHLVGISIFQDAAHSMAAVGMLVPMLESALKEACNKIGQSLPLPKKQSGGIVADFMKIAKNSGMLAYLPTDLRPTLEALFEYRNKMFHWGFEWPSCQTQKFNNRLNDWTPGWFEKTESGKDPWIFYMSPTFVEHCLSMTEKIINGLGDFLIDYARAQRGLPPVSRNEATAFDVLPERFRGAGN